MIHLLNVEEWAERYQNGDLLPEELKMLHATLEEDSVLNKAFEQALQIQVLIKEHARKTHLKSKLAQAAVQHRAQSGLELQHEPAKAAPKTGVWMAVKRYWKPISAAAGIALCSSLFTYTLTKDTKSKNNQYVLLKRDIESIKKSQNQIISNMKQTESSTPVPPVENPGTFGGSGFAINNDGYFTTNYHVVEKADSIYLQMSNGKFFKASVIKVNPEADLAILKVEDKNFSFKQPLPYTIDKNVALLGQRIFSIGYPKDEVVYNEGYISSEKGYDGNTLAYQLEITANPGQSGAPVLDNNGNIIGIITGKQNNTSGTTFAVHAEQLVKMIADLSKDKKVNLNNKNRYSTNPRPEQVKSLREFVCAVRVY
ncbi:MAG: hypothetical protein BGO31_19155 [Bacteroidetes bacterium 43-16]|nr:MAG: hypothetical protein BGO31_19155 [Bacteroidetes bacterium 43-16]